MNKLLLIFITFVLVWIPFITQADDDIKKIIIEKSIQSYSGKCPCPYSLNKAGRRCGKHSAWSKPGGESPKCFPSDVIDVDIKLYMTSKE